MTLEDEVVKSLKNVIDPETNISVYDMGLVSNLSVKGSNVSLTFTPSSPYCPLGLHLAVAIKQTLKSVHGVENVDVNVRGHIGEKELNEKLKRL